MNAPKWQRARFISRRFLKDRGYVGREFWVKIGPPVEGTIYERVYTTHLMDSYGDLKDINATAVELLCRSTEDFADDVKSEDFDVWSSKGAYLP